MGSRIFYASRDQAQFVAECGNLVHEITTERTDTIVPPGRHRPFWNGGCFDLWEDSQTGGGGARVVWSNGVVWITRHSGYAYADITEEVSEIFCELGCKDAESVGSHANPHIYG